MKYESRGQKLETDVNLSKMGVKAEWLIDLSSSAAVFFLYPGERKSKGSHAEGPGTFIGGLDQELIALSDFVKKYVHPGVPLFVGGHSYGGSTIHRFMQMTGEREEGFFHKNLSSLIITSPAVDPAHGASLREEHEANQRRSEDVMENRRDQMALFDRDFVKQMIMEGSTLENFLASVINSQTDDEAASSTDSHLEAEGLPQLWEKYLPAILVLEENKPSLYSNFERMFGEKKTRSKGKVVFLNERIFILESFLFIRNGLVVNMEI